MTTVVTNDAAGANEEAPESKEQEAAPVEEVKQEATPASAEEATDAATTEEGTEAKEDTKASSEEGEQKKKLSGFQRRMQKYERQVQDAQIEAEYWRRQAMQAQSAQTAPGATSAEPALKDFDNVEDYIVAREKYLLEKVVPQKVAEIAGQTAQQTQQQRMIDAYTQRVQEVVKEIPDYTEVVADLPDLPIDVQEFLIGSEVGPKLTYHLAQNEELVQRLNSLSPLRRAAELGKLELTVSQPKAAAPKKVTAAPAVAPKVKADPAAKVVTDLSQAKTFQEYKALRLKQLRERHA